MKLAIGFISRGISVPREMGLTLRESDR